MGSVQGALGDMVAHIPVLAGELLRLCEGVTLKRVVDGTIGAGGHASLLLEAHPEIEVLWGNDQDPRALSLCQERFREDARVVLEHGNFASLPGRLQRAGVAPDLILLDLGVSSMQLDEGERGFSFQQDGPLDMRMNPEESLHAAEIVAHWPEEALANLFYELGEERRSRVVARAIVERRRTRPFTTTGDLAGVVASVVPRTGRLHPATRVFQALRMAVNRELEVLEGALLPLAECLSPGGMLVVITFHSLEDRLVKWAFRSWPKERWDLLTKKVIAPTFAEVKTNRRARSAKLRAIRLRG